MIEFSFFDYYQNEVRLVFNKFPFSEKPGHVWVVCRFNGDWLLTRHSQRGLEFPGGKVEKGESAKQAAIREVWEETGGEVDRILHVGQYMVYGKAETVIKNIYFAEIARIEEKDDYMETNGPVILSSLPRNLADNPSFSFIMKDEVLPRTLEYLQKKELF